MPREYQFFKNIQINYGNHARNILKSISKTLELISKMKNRIIFLKRCRDEGVFPAFLNFNLKHLYQDKNVRNLIFNFKYQLLCSEIRNAQIALKKSNFKKDFLLGQINTIIPYNIINKFLIFENTKNEKNFVKIKEKNISKLEKLIQTSNNLFYTFKRTIQKNLDTWLINLSETIVPNDFSYIFALGHKFNFISKSIHKNNKFLFDFVASINKGIQNARQQVTTDHFDADLRDYDITTHKCNYLLNKFKQQRHVSSELDIFYKRLDRDICKAKKFLRQHKDLLFLKADKGNASVLFKKEEYNKKMFELLDDSATYDKLNVDPTTSIQMKMNKTLQNLQKRELITFEDYKNLSCSNGNAARIYGVVKTHKPGNKLRPVVSTIGTPTYKLAKYISNVLKPLVEKSSYIIKNSFELVDRLKHFKSDNNDFCLFSLDVESLFTNVPIDLALNYIKNNFVHLETIIDLDSLITLILFIFNSSIITYQKRIYKQIFGCPMGNPLSPIIADLALMFVEEKIFCNLNIDLPLYVRYVDDTLILAPSSVTDIIFTEFNNFHDRLKFTIEKSINNKINFLDITIQLFENSFKINWYHKQTWTGRFLNFLSCDPISYKRGIIYNLVDKAFWLSDSKYLDENCKLIISVLKKNCYPENFIKNNINKRLHHLRSGKAEIDRQAQKNKQKLFISLPYHFSLEHSIKSILQRINLTPAWKSFCSTSMLFSKTKDIIEINKRSNVVYQIFCNFCDPKTCYIGETKQYLQTRKGQHIYHIQKNNSNHSGLCQHALEHNHTFDFDNAVVLHSESTMYKRKMIEALFIHTIKNNCNEQTDYGSVIKNFGNIFVD